MERTVMHRFGRLAPTSWPPPGIAVLLLAWVALIRLPFLDAGPINHDESFYWLFGNAWIHGDWPYVRYWDLKPPGLFALYAGIAAVFGPSIAGPRLAAALAVWLTSLALLRLGERHFGGRGVGLLAALLYVPYTIVWFGLAGEPESFTAPLSAFAAGCVLDAHRGDHPDRAALLAGLCMGAAAMLKQTTALEGLFFCAALVDHRDLRRIGWFVAGGLVVPLAFVALFAAQGLLAPLRNAAVVAALARTGGDTGSQEAILKFVVLLWPAAPLVATAVVTIAERNRVAPSRPLLFLALWMLPTLAAVALMRASLQYYYIPLLPPLALASAVAASAAWSLHARWRPALVAVAALAVVFPVVWFELSLEGRLTAARTPRNIADHLATAAAGRPATLHVLDYQPFLYQASGLTPVAHWVLPMHLLCPFPAAKIDPDRELDAVLAARPDFVVVSAARRTLLCQDVDRTRRAVETLRPDYRRDAVFDDELVGEIEVWRRTDR